MGEQVDKSIGLTGGLLVLGKFTYYRGSVTGGVVRES
jgi:hypothetical protein